MNNKRKGKIKFIIFVIFILVAVFVSACNIRSIKNINLHDILSYCEKYKSTAMIIYLFIFCCKPFLVIIPSNIIAIAGGILFGPILGFLLTMTGFFISGTLAFAIARFLGKDFVEGIIGKRLMKLDSNMEQKGFKILLYLRLPPVLPYDPLSYAAGLTKISYYDFILASVIGVVPETICYSIIGKEAANPLSIRFLLPLTILIFAVLFSKVIMDKRDKIS